jgi:hypothetical protein
MAWHSRRLRVHAHGLLRRYGCPVGLEHKIRRTHSITGQCSGTAGPCTLGNVGKDAIVPASCSSIAYNGNCVLSCPAPLIPNGNPTVTCSVPGAVVNSPFSCLDRMCGICLQFIPL